MAEDRLERICVAAQVLPLRAAWAEGTTVNLPEWIASILRSGGGPDLEDPDLMSKAAAAADALRARAAYISHPPMSARLPVSYRKLPPAGRRVVARALGLMQRLRQSSWSSYPGWPLDLSADLVADIAGDSGVTFAAQTPVLLTHDIDSPEGLDNLVRMFLPLEENVQARSANYIVPCAWDLDHSLLAEVRARGHEVGIHGYDHANLTAFAAPPERRRRLTAGRALAYRYGAVGYRAPSLVRTKALLSELAGLYRYDSSIPTSGGPFPVPNNGCASARPWRIGALWELPISLPRDGSLRFLGYRPREIAALWRSTAEAVARSGGVVCILTHCEAQFSGNEPMLEVYRSFLEWIAATPHFRFLRALDLVDEMEKTLGGEHERVS